MSPKDIDWGSVSLGERSDADIARELGCTRSAVQRVRTRLEIPPFDPWAGAGLGERPDSEIAKERGVNRSAVCMARQARGIPAPPPSLCGVGQSTLRLAREREARGLSRRALSAMAGLMDSHVSKIESGLLRPRLETLKKIARALDWPDGRESELLEEVAERPGRKEK